MRRQCQKMTLDGVRFLYLIERLLREYDGLPEGDVARWVDGAFACANHIARLVVGINANESARTTVGPSHPVITKCSSSVSA